MYSQQLKVNRIVGIVHTVLAILVNSSNAQVSLSFESSCHYAGDTLVLVAQYSGGSTVNSIDWYFDKQTAANIVVMASTCSVFGGADAGYPNSRMSYSCDTGTNTYKATISNLDGTEVGEWGVILTFNDFTTTTIVKTTVSLCTECNVTSVQNGAVNSTQSTVRQDTVIGIKCDAGYTIDGSSALTCQSDGTWDKQWPTCPRTSTASTTTTISTSTTSTTTTTTTTTTPSPSPTTTTPQPSSSTTTSTPNPTTTSASPSTATLSLSTSTTSTSVNPETSTTARTSTAAATPKGDSNKSLITMIIVVSVIGGILMIAIFLIIFLLVHWKNCIAQKGRQRHNTHSLYYSDHNRRPHRQFKHTKSKQRSERSFQPHHVLEGYSFYRGGIKNPVFEDTIDSPAVVYYRDNVPDYIEPPPEYQYANNWEELGKQ